MSRSECLFAALAFLCLALAAWIGHEADRSRGGLILSPAPVCVQTVDGPRVPNLKADHRMVRT